MRPRRRYIWRDTLREREREREREAKRERKEMKKLSEGWKIEGDTKSIPTFPIAMFSSLDHITTGHFLSPSLSLPLSLSLCLILFHSHSFSFSDHFIPFLFLFSEPGICNKWLKATEREKK